MTTFEQFLRKKVRRNNLEYSPDFRLIIQKENDGGVQIMAHPFGEKGETVKFYVKKGEVREI